MERLPVLESLHAEMRESGGPLASPTLQQLSLEGLCGFTLHSYPSLGSLPRLRRLHIKLVPNLASPGLGCVTVATLDDLYTGPVASAGADGTLDTFRGVSGGKQICFDVTPKGNTTVMNTDQPQIFRAVLQVKGQPTNQPTAGIVNLGVPRQVFFLVPPVIKNGPIN